MRVVLILSARKVHRKENLRTFNAVKRQLKGIVWTQGSAFDLAWQYAVTPANGAVSWEFEAETA